jgi:hypothetical protein
MLVRKSEEKRPFGIPRSRWEDIVKIELKYIGCKRVNRLL